MISNSNHEMITETTKSRSVNYNTPWSSHNPGIHRDSSAAWNPQSRHH